MNGKLQHLVYWETQQTVHFKEKENILSVWKKFGGLRNEEHIEKLRRCLKCMQSYKLGWFWSCEISLIFNRPGVAGAVLQTPL